MSAIATDEQTEKKGESFTTALATRIDDIAPLLPKHISKERFTAAAHAAVKQNPDLLNCSVRSLFNAFTKAAQDGLLPDGREGIINSYNTKTEINGKEVWVPTAQWSPMTYGIRKRARELDGIIIDAQVVRKKDYFKQIQGDDPKILHEPAAPDEDPGPMTCAYAIFKREDGTILHREVMRAAEIEATREQSRAKNSLMWTKFATEGYRKSVVRRGSKTVPVSEKLQALIERDDEAFDFSQDRPNIRLVSSAPLTPPPAPPAIDDKQAPAVVPSAQTAVAPTAKPEAVVVNAGAQDDETYAEWLRDCHAELEACGTERAVEDVRERVLPELQPEHVQPWKAACAEKATELFKGGKR